MKFHLRSTLSTVAVLFAILLVFISLSVHAQEKTVICERFDVDIIVNADGSFQVTEHTQVHLAGGVFTRGYREIPIHLLSSIDEWEVTDSNGNEYQLITNGTTPYTFTVEELSSSYLIYWYFAPTQDETTTYRLSYRVHGGLRHYPGADEIWWNAIYGDRPFSVQEGRVTVVLPAPARLWAAYIDDSDASRSVTATQLDDRCTIIFELEQPLQAGKELSVRVEYEANGISPLPQTTYVEAEEDTSNRQAEIVQLIHRLGEVFKLLQQRFGGVPNILFTP